MNNPQLFVAHYRAFNPIYGVPVQISNGKPKYGLDYPLRYKAQLLYPEWSMVKSNVSMGEFNRRYHEVLDSRGVDNIRGLLEDIAEHAGDNRLVLMCFEKDPADCHRAGFADWWEKNTGETVPEVP